MGNGGILSAILSEQPDDVLEDLERQLKKRIADARAVSPSRRASSRSSSRRSTRAGRARCTTPTSRRGALESERDREADGRFHGIPRATVLAVASTVPYPITPVRVVEAFAERGETVNVEQIRIALNRLAKDGGLTKVGPSLFAVPGTRPTELHTMPQRQPASRSGLGPGAAREGPARAGCQPERVSTNAPELVLVDDVAATLDSVHLDDRNPGAIATLEVAVRR